MLDQTRESDGGRTVWRDEDGVHGLVGGREAPPPAGSLTDDLSALYADTKTYASAELTYQKTRASYAGKKGTKAAVYGLGALTVLNLALIGLTVGAIISLATLVGPLAATLIVVVLLLIVAGFLGYLAKQKASAVSRVFAGEKP